MVKAKITRADGGVSIVMGISDANVARLMDGQPIFFDPAALRIVPGTAIVGITLFHGRDEAALAEMLRFVVVF